MTSRHFSKYANPSTSYQFSRGWDDGPEQVGLPANRILRRIDRQRAKSQLAKCLQAAQMAEGDERIIVTAFAMADQCRRALGVSWADIVTGRAA